MTRRPCGRRSNASYRPTSWSHCLRADVIGGPTMTEAAPHRYAALDQRLLAAVRGVHILSTVA
ncbi:MAG: hypothetical protein ABI300_10095, partial [Rhodanobacter sp.]